MEKLTQKSLLDSLSFNSDGLVAVTAVCTISNVVLMQAWANKEAIIEAIDTQRGVYFSRSRQKLWRKGEESGNIQKLIKMWLDCDGDSVIYEVQQEGNACHLNTRSCFSRMWDGEKWAEEYAAKVKIMPGESTVSLLSRVIEQRDAERESTAVSSSEFAENSSYVAYLLNKGLSAINAKISEESQEVIEAAKGETSARVAAETADLWFHSLILLQAKGLASADVEQELLARLGKSGIAEKLGRNQ